MFDFKLSSLSCLLFLLLSSTWCAGQKSSTGFDETFALSENRADTLKELIPGTKDYYFYHCLERQHAQAWDEVETLLASWVERHGHTPRVRIIKNRQALLRYSDDPKATMKYLESRLALRFDHQPKRSARELNLPSVLDEDGLSQERWIKRALAESTPFQNGFTESGIAALSTSLVSDRLLGRFLNHISVPDIPNLATMVIREMKSKNGHRFGTLKAHQALTLAQMNACAQEHPSLLHDKNFVTRYVQLLKPTGDVDVTQDWAARRDFLKKLQTFTNRLSPSQNSLKAQVLFQRLLLDQRFQEFNKDRFLAFIKLPIHASYMNDDYLRRQGNAVSFVDPEAGRKMGIPTMTGNQQLIRSYLEHFFVADDSTAPYAPYLDERFLNRILAETKILAGIGDMERWYSLLGNPTYYEQLKNRVEVKLARHNKIHLGPNESVSLDLDIKNVKTLLIKVYEINTANYYAENGKEVDPSIAIDGLVATEEFSFQYTDSPLRRVRRTFNFPSLARPGVWVIEFIGNGLSSRAIVAKGRLQFRERMSSSGQVFRVFDDNGQLQKDASILFGQKKFLADDDGEILIPFSTRPQSKTFVLLAGSRASLGQFFHQAETYSLVAPAFLPQESLIAGSQTKILIRPKLMINGQSASLELLEENFLIVTSTNHLGIKSTLEVRNLQLKDNEEYTHTISVPHNLAHLTIQLRGKVQQISRDRKVTLVAGRNEFKANLLAPTTKTVSPLLTRTTSGYEIHVLGKNGETVADYVIDLFFSHKHFKKPYHVRLKTNGRGIISLGALNGIRSIQTNALVAAGNSWDMRSHGQEIPSKIHGVQGETIRLPYLGQDTQPSRSSFALFRRNRTTNVQDYFSHIALKDGFLELRGLEQGNYLLTLKDQWKAVSIAVSGGPRSNGWAQNKNRELALTTPSPFHVSKAEINGDQLAIQCRNAGITARVHVFATRFLPSNQPFARLRVPQGNELESHELNHIVSSYYSGIAISDEYRYILDRRFAVKYPGNMLKRPELLLNPWALDDANDSIGLGGGSGGNFGGRKGGQRSRGRRGPGSIKISHDNPGLFANYRFMPAAPFMKTNLRPDASGRLLVNLKELGDGHVIHVVATSGNNTIYRQVIRETQTQTFLDNRLTESLDRKKHIALKKSINFIRAGETVQIVKAAGNRIQQFQTIGDIYDSMRSLSGNQELSHFAFLTDWPKLKKTEKHALYSEYACHELHFFLSQKDPAFFKEVVKPYLSNKTVKTFMDDWLLERDMTPYLDSAKFAHLNVLERILLLRRTQGSASTTKRYANDLLAQSGMNASRYSLFESALLETKSLAKNPPSVGFSIGAIAPAPSRKVIPIDKRMNQEPALNRNAPIEEADEDAEEFAQTNKFKRQADEKARVHREKSKSLRAFRKRHFRQVSPTRRYAEHNYWHRTDFNTTANMIGINRFWSDFASHESSQPFVSVNFFETTNSLAEMILALSVIDLPFVSGKHKVVDTSTTAQMTARTPLILVKREIGELLPSQGHEPILANQSFFKVSEPTMEVDGQKRQKTITGEFLTGEAYGCRLVISNPTQVRQKLNFLAQIPAGSIPLKNTQETASEEFFLDGYRTRTFTYYFYFPRIGTFTQYPVQIAEGNKLITAGSGKTFKVVATLSVADKTSWDYVSQNGSSQEVMTFLKQGNVLKIDLDRIAWRLNDRDFWAPLIDYLRSRFIFNRTLWSYAVLHQDKLAAGELLSHERSFKIKCGSYLVSPLLSFNPTELKLYQHLEFAPLVNSRSHRFGKVRRIQNSALANQFASFTKSLAYQGRLTDDNWLEATYYLLLQDRIEEALLAARKVNPQNIDAHLQFDYVRAYLDLYTPGIELANTIAARHLNHPIPRWRKKFEELSRQLDEIANPEVASKNSKNPSSVGETIEKSPTLDLKVKDQSLLIGHANMTKCEVSYYEMDIEFLFSVNPFVRNESGSFAFVRPNLTETIHFDEKDSETTHPLPQKYRNANLLVEVTGAGLVKRQTCFSNSLAVKLNERWGQLQVKESKTGKPLSRVYVKVFAKDASGQVRFHKDGYTDLRGRFHYASLSGPSGQGIKKFSILILSKSKGAMVREVNSPTQ